MFFQVEVSPFISETTSQSMSSLIDWFSQFRVEEPASPAQNSNL